MRHPAPGETPPPAPQPPLDRHSPDPALSAQPLPKDTSDVLQDRRPDLRPCPAVPRPSAPGGNVGRSVLGADLRITGEITSTGSVEVLGEIDGNITAHGLIIGQEGRVKGSVNADTVEVKGQLDGKVTCESFTLRVLGRRSRPTSPPTGW